MTEWLKVRAWKVRIPQKGIVGSNPAFSATFSAEYRGAGRVLSVGWQRDALAEAAGEETFNWQTIKIISLINFN